MHLTLSVALLLLIIMLGPLLLAIGALVLAVKWQQPASRRLLLLLLLPQCLIAAVMLWQGLNAVGLALPMMAWLVLFCALLTLLFGRWRPQAWLQALVSGWALFILLAAAFWFYPQHQSAMEWARHQQQVQHNLGLLQRQAWADLDRLPSGQQRELFFRAVEQDYPVESYHYFIRQGISPLDRQEFGFTPFSNAIEHHNPVALDLFLRLMTPAQIQALTFDHDPLRDLRLEPPYHDAERKKFYRSMALLLKARPDWIHPRSGSSPSYFTTAIFNGYTESANFLLAWLPAPQGVWQLALLALNGQTQPLMNALHQQPAQLEETLTEGAGRRLSLMEWLIKYAAQPTRQAVLESNLIAWDRFQRASADGKVENTLVNEARGNWRFRDENPTVLQQVLVSAVRQRATLPAAQLADILRYDEQGVTLAMLIEAGLPCSRLLSVSALLKEDDKDIRARQRIAQRCSAPT